MSTFSKQEVKILDSDSNSLSFWNKNGVWRGDETRVKKIGFDNTWHFFKWNIYNIQGLASGFLVHELFKFYF